MNILFKYAKREAKDSLFTAFLLVVGSIFRVAHALLNALILTALVSGNMQRFLAYLALDASVFLAFSLWLILTDWQRAKTVGKLGILLRKDISSSLIGRPYQKFASRDSGVYASWLTSDVETIEQKGFNNLFNLVQVVSDPLFSVIALFSYHWSLVLLAFVVSIVMVEIPQLLRSKLSTRNLETTKQNERLFSDINNQLLGYETLFSLGIQQKLVDAIRAASYRFLHVKMRQVKVEATVNNGVGFLNIAGQLLTSGWTGILVLKKLVPVGAINSTVSLSYNILNCLAVFSPVLTEMQSLDAIFGKYDLSTYANLEKQPIQKLPRPGDSAADALSLSKVGFSYQGTQKPTLNEFSLQINPGQKVLITGESGSGKSTLLNMLAGKLTGYTGSITIDDRELSKMSIADIQQHVLYVSQRPYLFNGSILSNLLLGDKFSDSEIQNVLEMADLTDYINSLPDGLDTNVGENGKSISGGQQQRIALARSLLRLPKRGTLLLDEVTNSLSEESAIRVEHNILAGTDITVIMVSHQVHQETLADFDVKVEIKGREDAE